VIQKDTKASAKLRNDKTEIPLKRWLACQGRVPGAVVLATCMAVAEVPCKAARPILRVLPSAVSELTIVVAYITVRVAVDMASFAGRISGHTVDILPLLRAGRVAEVVRSALGRDVVRYPLPCDLAELLLHGKRVGALKVVDAGELLSDNLVQQRNLFECMSVYSSQKN